MEKYVKNIKVAKNCLKAALDVLHVIILHIDVDKKCKPEIQTFRIIE